MLILEWNGTELPSALRLLPPGRYLIEPIDEPLTLSAEEEAGLMQAIKEADAGDTYPAAEVMAQIRAGRRL
jgi:hypothetical protein